MTTPPAKVRLNLSVADETRQVIEAYATQWTVGKGGAVDRLVQTASITETASQQAEGSLSALEEMLRRVVGDAVIQTARMQKTLLEPVHTEATTTRLLLFALLASMKGPAAAVANEEEALRVARDAVREGRLPLLLRKKKPDA